MVAGRWGDEQIESRQNGMLMMAERVFGWERGKSRQEVEGVEAKTLQGGFHAIQYTYTLEYTW